MTTCALPRPLAAVVLLMAFVRPAPAQTVEGRLVDRLSHRPVAGATVHLLTPGMQILASGASRDDGGFRISLPEGADPPGYFLVEADGFSRLLSDPLRSDPLRPGASLRLGDVGIHPLGWSPELVTEVELDARTVAGWCAGVVDPERHGVVVGRVRDERTGEGLAGVPVRIDWTQDGEAPRLVVGGVGAPWLRTTSGAGGLFHFCPVPAGEVVQVAVELEAGREREATSQVEASAVNRVDLVIPFTRPGQGAALFGRVLDGSTGRPVSQARVRISGEGLWALTNQRGFFALEELPTGFQILEVEHLGYAPQRHPVILEPGMAGEVVLPLAADPVELEGIRVTVRSGRRLRGIRELERRRELGLGTFFDQEAIQARGIHYLGDVLRETPGMGARVVGRGVARRYVIRRVRAGGEDCVPAVFLNGNPYRLPDGLLELSATEMELVEVHRAPGVPPEFAVSHRDARSCGVVSAWTRAGR